MTCEEHEKLCGRCSRQGELSSAKVLKIGLSLVSISKIRVNEGESGER